MILAVLCLLTGLAMPLAWAWILRRLKLTYGPGVPFWMTAVASVSFGYHRPGDWPFALLMLCGGAFGALLEAWLRLRRKR